MTQRAMHRSEPPEHPFVSEAKQLAREAGSTDNRLINWIVRMKEEALAFGNRARS